MERNRRGESNVEKTGIPVMDEARGEREMTMRRLAAGAAVAMTITIGIAGTGLAQDIQISDNGGNVSNSAAGASNVRMERSGGREAALSGDGQGNQEIRRGNRAARPERERNRDRGGNNGGEWNDEAAAEGYMDPAAAGWEGEPEWQPEPVWEPEAAAVPASGSPTSPIRLPNTGSALAGLATVISGLMAAAAASAGLAVRRRSGD
jgi:hypothetical protein